MEGLRGSGLIASCLAAAFWVGAAAHAQNAAPEEIVWSADSWARTGDTYVIRNPRIEGGDIRIEADEAVTTTLPELNTTWDLSGSIRVVVGTAELHAETAAFEFEAGELVAGDLAGDPATFEDTAAEQAGPVRGEASRIVYDREAGTVQMRGSARFMLPQGSMSGCDFLYELDGGLVSGSSECGVPLEVIYVPQSEEEPSEDGEGDADEPEESAPDEAPRSP